jgi:hypothetical protein
MSTLSSTPYPLKETSPYVYEFTSDSGIRYIVYFLDYSFMLPETDQFTEAIYTFNIEILGNAPAQLPQDNRISTTVATVLRLFFEKIQNVAVYVCDSTDKRQMARKRKFDAWFRKYNDGNIIKEDGIVQIEGITILNAILIHKKHPNLQKVLVAYKKINHSASEK